MKTATLTEDDVQDYAWDVISELPQVLNTRFSLVFRAKKIAEFYSKKGIGLSMTDTKRIAKAVNNLA